MKASCWWYLPVACGLLLAGCAEPQGQRVVVFTAASMVDVVEHFASRFQEIHPDLVVDVSVGASSLLARQIESGAPADVYLSASQEWMDFVDERGLVEGVRSLVGNRLVLVSRPPVEGSIPNLLLASETVALGDPDHVPAGIYARESLECMNVWTELGNRIIPAVDVRAALQSVRVGAVESAVVYFSDAQASKELSVLEIADSCQPEITFSGAVVSASGSLDAASSFLDFMSHADHSGTWVDFGFVSLPAEPSRP